MTCFIWGIPTAIFVFLQKEPSNKVVLDKATGWYKLVCLPDDGEHLITVVKVTEAAMSHAGFVTVKIEDGELLKRSFPVRPELKLEFIGDSITCGYGVLGEPLVGRRDVPSVTRSVPCW